MMITGLPRRGLLVLLFSLAIVVGHAAAQQASSTIPSPTSTTPAPSSSPQPAASPINTIYTTIYATTLSPGQQRPSGASSLQNVFLTTATVTPSLALPLSTTIAPAPSASPVVPVKADVQIGLPLVTIVDPAFGILGALLILSGICMAFVGHRSRWLICLVCGFYSFALITICVILRVGVSRAVNDPDKTLKGLYLLASICAGCIGAGLYVIFRSGGLLMSSALGGFVLALYLQACKSDGIIQAIGIRYILYIAFSTVLFALACHRKLQPFVLIFSTALIGATSIILGIDCFTRANLKEFYIRNIGFDDLFSAKYPQEFAHGRWFLSTPSVIELGVIGGLTVMAIAFQSKMWSEFRTSLLEMRNSDEERHLRSKAKRATRRILASAQKDLREWEERHGYQKTAGRDDELESRKNEEAEFEVLMTTSPMEKSRGHSRKTSSLSVVPLQSIDSPILDLPASTLNGPSLGSSLGLAPSPVPPVSTTPEHRRLMDEIATIRKSINDLQSMPMTNIDVSIPTMPTRTHTKSLGANEVMDAKGAMEKEKMMQQTASPPWVTSERNRARSHSVSGLLGKSSPVDTNLFMWREESDPRPAVPRLELEIPHLPSSNIDLNNTRGRATPASADFRLSDAEGSVAFPMPAAVQLERQKSMLALVGRQGEAKAQEGGRQENKRSQHTSYDASNRLISPTRSSFVPDTSAAKVTQDRKSRRNSTMSIDELQARHQSLLRNLQQPTSERMDEVARLQEAQHEWEERKRREKLRWEEIERRRSVSGSRTLSTPLTTGRSPQSPSLDGLAKLEAVPEQDSLSRASEWRRSLQLTKDESRRDSTRRIQ